MRKIILGLLLGVSMLLGEEKAVPPPFEMFTQEGYTSKYTSDIGEENIDYIDVNNTKHKITLHGKLWHLRMNLEEDKQLEKIAEIIKSLKELGAEELSNNKEKEQIVLKYIDPVKNEKIYILIHYGWPDNFRVSITKERWLDADNSIEVEFDENRNIPKELLYLAPFDGKHFYSLEVEILEGRGVRVSVDPDMEHEPIRIRNEVKMECDSQYYKKYTMYNLDPYKAVHHISIKPKEGNTKVKITLCKSNYAIPELGKISAKPATFTLKNSLSSLPVLKSIGSIGSNALITGDYLPNGDAIYWATNGYYYFIKDKLRTNLVPLLASHMTTVDWPIYFEDMKRGISTDGNMTTKMAIYETKSDDNTTVQIDLSLSHLPKDMNLSKEDFTVFEEGSIEGKVLSLERLPEPMNIVILLDSSGSMKKSMKLARKSVKSFIEKLPEDAKVTLVDFDTKVKPVKAKNRAEVLKKLSKIKANGATALYDSVIKGTALLQEKSRASVILFTDGKDANYNDTKRGSKATFDMMIKEVQKDKIPIYPIAFGNAADTTSLMSIADMTKTTYYQGDTEEKLAKIFDDIRHTLSSAYRVNYDRGKAAKEGSQPVVNYMVDVSGSMDLRFTMFKDCKGCGYRFEPLKEMLAKSVEALPENTFIQLNTFSSDINTLQIMTQDKAKVLAGIGAIKIGGGTEIIKAVKKGLAFSKILPSNRRYFIFTTDAAGDAFKFDKDQKKELNAALIAFKRSGIQTFWLGMWKDKTVVKNMNYLAKMSGGEAFVSSDIEKIKEKILSVTQKISESNVTQERIGSVVVKVKKVSKKDGEILTAVGEKEIDLPLLKEEKPSKTIKDIAYNIKRFNADKKSYNVQNATQIYGADLPLKEVRLNKIIPLIDDHNQTIQGQNRAMHIAIPKAYIFDRIKGLNAGHRYEYLVLDMNLSNILPSQKVAILDDGSKYPSSWINQSNENYEYKDALPTYRIPNLKNHLFIRVNNSYEVPFNPLTWALEKPLTQIDETILTIEGNSSKEGVLLFKIPDAPITSLSLHYYDTAYGHIDLPIIGKMKQIKKEINSLPKEASGKLGDTFNLSVISTYFTEELMGVKNKKEDIFEVLNIAMESQVNALLSLDPQKRFRLKIETPQGDWMLPPHGITENIPMGFYKEISLAPGSNNHLALAFQIPKKYQKYPQSLVIELKGEDKEIVIVSKNKEDKKHKSTKVLSSVSGDKIKLLLNNIVRVDRVDGGGKNAILVDITLLDEEDGSATRLHNMLVLSNNDKVNVKGRKTAPGNNQATHKGLGGFSSNSKTLEKSKKFVSISGMTSSRLLGCDNMVLDGYKKRCLLLFELDTLDEKKPLYLLSGIFKDLKYSFKTKTLKKIDKKQNYLLSKIVDVPQDYYQDNVDKILAKVRQQKILQGKQASLKPKRKISLDAQKDLPQEVVPLPVSYAGAQKMFTIKTLQEAINAVKEIDWVPAYDDRSYYSAQSMFTQGWGTEFEMVQYVYSYLRSRNIEIKAGYFPLTDIGKTALQERAKGIPLKRDSVPYLSWEEDGEKRTLVFPFVESLDTVKTYVDASKPSNNRPLGTNNAEIKMTLYYTKKKTTASIQMGGMGASLSGGNTNKEKDVEILSDSFPLNQISNMPVDVWFGLGENRDGEKVVQSFLYSEKGIVNKLTSLPANIVPSRLKIGLYDGNNYTDEYTFRFKKDQTLQDLFFTFSFASPDLKKEVLDVMEDAKKEKFANVKNLESLSMLQWMNRNKIYRFIGLQSQYEKKLAEKLNLNVKRNSTPRTIMAMMEKSTAETLISSFDLRSVQADVYGEKNNTKAFHMISGMFATEAEGNVIPESETVFTLWEKKQGLKLLTILPDNKEQALSYMKDQKIPEWIVQRLDNSNRIWVFPAVDIEERYGWLEINPDNYTLLSVLDNGQYSAMTETVITQENIETTTRYFLGLLIGGNIAIGSVINYSLLGYESYEEIKKRGEKLAKVLGCYVKKFESVSGDVIGTAKGAAKDEAKNKAGGGKGDSIENMINSTFDCKDGGKPDGKKPKEYKDFVNFGKGIDHAISQYFKNM